jgi:putative ABC transport system permease protein
MFKHNINLAFRLIFRNKVFSAINIIGLAFGLACSILLFLWVRDEFQFDKFNKNINETFVFQHWQHYGDENFPCPVAPAPLAPALKKDYPQIAYAFRADAIPSVLVTRGDKSFVEQVRAVDPDILKILTFTLIEGSLDDALVSPNSMVITETIAKKYFGEESPIGKEMVIDKRISYKVTAVIKEFPSNSTYQFTVIIPFETLKNFGANLETWGNNWCRTIVMLQKGVNYKEFEKTVQGFINKHRGPESSKVEEFLYPFSRLHLYNIMGGGQIVIVKIFIIIAILILLIACINYTNLSSARAAARAKEIAMRKVSGAEKWQLIKQFIGESLFFSFIALNFSLIIVRLLLPAFNNMAGKMIKLNYLDPQLIITLILIWILTGIVAGLYPAFVLSSFNPIKAVKSDSKVGSKKSIFRIALVLVQFSIAIGLIISTLVVFKQLVYLKRSVQFN